MFHKKCKQHDSDSDPSKYKSKKERSKQKRKYLADNKVGSLEQVEVQCHSPPSTASSDFTLNEHPEKDNETIDKNAIISNYHKNKLLHDPKFTRDVSDDDFGINKYRREHLDDDETGSVGSFLSMISIRSFPKWDIFACEIFEQFQLKPNSFLDLAYLSHFVGSLSRL